MKTSSGFLAISIVVSAGACGSIATGGTSDGGGNAARKILDLDEPDLADLAGQNPGAHLAQHRIAGKRVGDGNGAAGRRNQTDLEITLPWNITSTRRNSP